MVNKLSISGIHWITQETALRNENGRMGMQTWNISLVFIGSSKEMALRNENGRKNGNGIELN